MAVEYEQRRMMAVGPRLMWWWYRCRWWTPESRTIRAFQRHGRAVYLEFLRRGLDGPCAEEATELAFCALFDRYLHDQSTAQQFLEGR